MTRSEAFSMTALYTTGLLMAQTLFAIYLLALIQTTLLGLNLYQSKQTGSYK